MADDADMSAAQQERILAATIAAQRLSGEGRRECEDCDQPIPEARRVAQPSARRCVACQQRWEASNGR
jgi:phage/conjugal plasmid C-4 type zinc finger TraR family protein